jgi:non-lysosomal glucosylceramidase
MKKTNPPSLTLKTVKSLLSSDLPVLRIYDQSHLDRIALPLGGIGTGTVSLGGRGDLRDWEVMNTPDKGFDLTENYWTGAFFSLWTRDHTGQTRTRVLEGEIPGHLYEHGLGAPIANHGLPRFRECAFAAAYPFGQVVLADADVPLNVRLEAFNPLVPADPEASGLPVAVLRYVLENTTGEPVEASVCGSIPNFIGADGRGEALRMQTKGNRNTFRKARSVQGIFMDSTGITSDSPKAGTMALVTNASSGVSHRTSWAPIGWGGDILNFWDDFSEEGVLSEHPPIDASTTHGSVAVRFRIDPHSIGTITFVIAWHFPNRLSWNKPPSGKTQAEIIGNYYTEHYRDAWDAAEQTVEKLPQLESRTREFVEAFCESDLPVDVKEAALFNLSTLRTQTTFRLPSGHLAAWEGCNDHEGSCPGSCTHVWNYENTTPFLFGSLSRSMREVEFLHATDDKGLMVFRTSLPLGREQEWLCAAADGQMGCLMRLYRDWQLSGDDAFLKSVWPKARKALEFCWLPGGWDADEDGVMEGAQHNTMDIEYYGPNPQMTGWYLGALRAMEEMARHLGEVSFAAKCHDLFKRGSQWMDEHLFNGEYYEHQIVPPTNPEAVLDGLVLGKESKDLVDPICQLGAGCLVDQLAGQYMAHVCGLGYLHDPAKVRQTLRSIMKYNFRENLRDHFNNMRSFAFHDESALLMGTYPLGRRPKRPFPYYNEVMTGFEYTAAIGMLYEGDTETGLRCIKAVRDRFDGKKRNPFNEAECGHHYARAMAAWAATVALTGFHYSAVTGAMRFAMPSHKKTRWFFSTGSAWGTATISRQESGSINVKLAVSEGEISLSSLALEGFGADPLPCMKKLQGPTAITFTVQRQQ